MKFSLNFFLKAKLSAMALFRAMSFTLLLTAYQMANLDLHLSWDLGLWIVVSDSVIAIRYGIAHRGNFGLQLCSSGLAFGSICVHTRLKFEAVFVRQ
jgi:hypothetical protein